MATRAKGTILNIFASASYHQIPDATEITWSGTTWDQEATTTHDTTTPVKTFQTTLYGNGDVTCKVLVDSTNTYHTLLKTLSQSGDANNFQFVDVNGLTRQFSGYVLSYVPTNAVNSLLSVTVKIGVNGAMTEV